MRLSFFKSPGFFHLPKKANFLINNQTKSSPFSLRYFSSFKWSNNLFQSTRKNPTPPKEGIFSALDQRPFATQSSDLPSSSNPTRFFSSAKKSDFIFRQLIDYKSFTYTYLLADAKSKEGVIIDPVLDNVNRDLRIINDLGVKLIVAMNTHVHADHITGSGLIKKTLSSCKSYISTESQAKADEHFHHGSQIPFGSFHLECRSTPGHTDGCYSFVWHEKNMVFPGDAVLIRGCGRTDFQQGDAEKLYDSVHKQIFSLPSHYLLFPAHDYTGQTMSTVGEEKELNPRLSKTKSEFVKIMQDLKLPYPDQIDKSLPANFLCGLQPATP